jgi:hypothetical protein
MSYPFVIHAFQGWSSASARRGSFPPVCVWGVWVFFPLARLYSESRLIAAKGASPAHVIPAHFHRCVEVHAWQW